MEVLTGNIRIYGVVNNIFSLTACLNSNKNNCASPPLGRGGWGGVFSETPPPSQTHCGLIPLSSGWGSTLSTWIVGRCEVRKEGLLCHCSFMAWPDWPFWLEGPVLCKPCKQQKGGWAALYASSCNFLPLSNTERDHGSAKTCTIGLGGLNNDRINPSYNYTPPRPPPAQYYRHIDSIIKGLQDIINHSLCSKDHIW